MKTEIIDIKTDTLLEDEKIELKIKAVKNLNLTPVNENSWPKNKNLNVS